MKDTENLEQVLRERLESVQNRLKVMYNQAKRNNKNERTNTIRVSNKKMIEFQKYRRLEKELIEKITELMNKENGKD